RYEVDYLLTRDGLESALVPDARLVSMAPDRVVLEVGGMRRDFTVAVHGAEVYVDSALGPVVLEAEPRFVDPATVVAAGSLLAPMPGTVIRLGAAVGETVTTGQPILWLEAMKMEHTIAAPVDGVLTELGAEVGAQVELGAVLAVVADPAADADSTDPTGESGARRGEPLTELWREAGRLGFLGVNLPTEYGGGGAGIYELALVQEELAAHGAGLLMVVVSPAICGTIIAGYGTEEQKQTWLPGIADGSKIMAFGITEPDAGSNSHAITTTARRDGEDWLLRGQKVFISGVDQADA